MPPEANQEPNQTPANEPQQQTEAEQSTTTPPSAMKHKKQRGKGLLIAGLVIANIIILGVGTLAFIGSNSSSSQDQLDEAMTSLIYMDDVEALIQIEIDQTEIDLKLQGDFPNETALLSAEAKVPLGPITSGDGVLNLGGEIRGVGEDWYVQVRGVEDAIDEFAASLSASPEDLEEFLGLSGFNSDQWSRINRDIIKDSFGTFFGDDIPEFGLANIIKQSDLEEIARIYLEHPLFEVVEDMGSEDINGVSATKLLIRPVSNEQAKEFDAALRAAELSFDAANLTLVDVVADTTETVDTFHVWVADGEPVRIDIAEQTSNDISINITFTPNAIVDISAPDDPVDLDPTSFGAVIAGLVISTTQGVEERARDTERKTDVNALHTQLEVYFNDNGFYPTKAQFGDPAWREENMPGLDSEAAIDPDGGSYTYEPRNCEAQSCANYVLSTPLEAELDIYEKRSLN